jgi:hypothetical protein
VTAASPKTLAVALALLALAAGCSSGSLRDDPPVLVPWHKISFHR